MRGLQFLIYHPITKASHYWVNRYHFLQPILHARETFLFLLFWQYALLFLLPRIGEILLPLIFPLQEKERILPANHFLSFVKTFRGSQTDLHQKWRDDNHWAMKR